VPLHTRAGERVADDRVSAAHAKLPCERGDELLLEEPPERRRVTPELPAPVHALDPDHDLVRHHRIDEIQHHVRTCRRAHEVEQPPVLAVEDDRERVAADGERVVAREGDPGGAYVAERGRPNLEAEIWDCADASRTAEASEARIRRPRIGIMQSLDGITRAGSCSSWDTSRVSSVRLGWS
jgi:hypothetical protein